MDRQNSLTGSNLRPGDVYVPPGTSEATWGQLAATLRGRSASSVCNSLRAISQRHTFALCLAGVRFPLGLPIGHIGDGIQVRNVITLEYILISNNDIKLVTLLE